MYALLTAIVLFRSMYVMEVNIRLSQRRKEAVDNKLQGGRGQRCRQDPAGAGESEGHSDTERYVDNDSLWAHGVLGWFCYIGDG